MKAIRLKAVREIELVEVDIPTIQDDELLIKTGAATICTTDLSDASENPFRIKLPVIMGHEGAGTVAAVGRKVSGFCIGDRVATHPVHPCGTCPECQKGLSHLCRNMGHFGINMPGTFAEYYRARFDRIRHIPDTLTFPVASLTEPVCVCLEALSQAKVSQGSVLLIIGDGPFGLMIARLASRFALSRLVIAGLIDFRLSFARQAIRVNLKDKNNPIEVLLKASGDEGFDVIILAVSSQSAFNQSLHCIKPKGRLVLFSALPGDTPVDLFRVHVKELEILGACNDQDRLDEAISILINPKFGLSEFVTHQFSLTDYRKALEMADTGKAEALKVAFVF